MGRPSHITRLFPATPRPPAQPGPASNKAGGPVQRTLKRSPPPSPHRGCVLTVTYNPAPTPISMTLLLFAVPVSPGRRHSGRKVYPMSLFKDAGHLFRFAFLFVVAFFVFLVVRHFVVPKTFGEYGHYRAAAI